MEFFNDMRLQTPKIIVLLLLLNVSGFATANPLLGGGRGQGVLNRPDIMEKPLRQNQLRGALTSREAVAIAERRYGGRAVGVRQVQSRSGIAYKVRILQDNGKIKNVIIDDY